MLAVAFCAAAGMPPPAFAQPPLSVPYLPQTEALCGGAAAAMVMRFWGARDVYADAFAPLVDWDAGGIRTSALTGALEARGWQTSGGGGDLQRLHAEVTRGRPVIALIEDRPGRFHYVVVVSAAVDRRIVLHDPARGPSRSLDASAFDAKWSKADRWMLVLLPGPPPQPSGAAAAGVHDDQNESDLTIPAACRADMDAGLTSAQAGDAAAARTAFLAAAGKCPGASAPWRELGGLAALARDWDATAANARRAVDADARDEHAWRLLATAEYLRHHDLEALAAWNAIGEPRTDLIEIKGLAQTRYGVVADAIGIPPRALLTPDALRVAQKRVRDLPAVAAARVSFHPVEGGRAQVDATVVERSRAPHGYPAWIGLGLGAVTNRELSASFANISDGGDAIEVSWRWWEHRPRVAASYAAPGPGGIWRIEASRETQTFRQAALVEETHTRVGATVGNWLTARAKIAGGLAIDRWQDRGRMLAASGRIEFWPAIERLALDGGISGWGGSGEGFASADAGARWRSSAASSGTVWLANAGYQLATSSAPASLWPGADTGHARDVLLRAHPLLNDGIVDGGVFGRRIAFASGEVQHWVQPRKLPLIRLAPAVFLDVARATRGLPASDTRLHYDAGAGIRVALLGFGVLRADVARGLRDGQTAFSVSWQR